MFLCLIQPKSKEERIVGITADKLKIRVKAPPSDGKANQQLIKFLAKKFQLKRSGITIVSGQSSRLKKLCIEQAQKLPRELPIKRN